MVKVERNKISGLAHSNLTTREAQRSRTIFRTHSEQLRARRGLFVGDKHAAALITHARAIFGPTQLLYRVQARITIGPNSQWNVGSEQFSVGCNPIAKIALGGGAKTDGAAGTSQQLNLCRTGMSSVYDCSQFMQCVIPLQQFDRRAATRSAGLLDLGNLLIGMHMQGKSMCAAILSDCAEPAFGYGAYRMRRHPDVYAGLAQRIHALQVGCNRGIAETALLLFWRPVKATPGICSHQQHHANASLASRLQDRLGHGVGIGIGTPAGLVMNIMKLAHC